MNSTRLFTRSLPSLLSPRNAHRTLALQLGTTHKASFHQSSAPRTITPPFKPAESITSITPKPTSLVAPTSILASATKLLTSFGAWAYPDMPVRTPFESYTRVAVVPVFFVAIGTATGYFQMAMQHQTHFIEAGGPPSALPLIVVLQVLFHVATLLALRRLLAGRFTFTREGYNAQVKVAKELGPK